MHLSTKAIGTLFLLGALSFVLTACKRENSPAPLSTISTKSSPQVVIESSVWNKYINAEYKYAIKIPNQFYISQGECVHNEQNNTYRLKSAPSPTQVYESGNDTFITAQISYQLEGPNPANGLTKYTECAKILSTQEDIPNKKTDTWKIHAINATSPKDIEADVKDQFGTECFVEVLKPTAKANIYDVVIGTNQKCEISEAYFYKYNEKSKTAISIKLGKSFTFNSSENFDNSAYDEAMLASLEFIE